MSSTLKRILIGRPLATDEADHQRISKTIGLAVFSSDAISSTAYATGEVMLVLVGAAGLYANRGSALGVEDTPDLLPWIAGLVVVLLAIVANSYRQTIHAYPDGGGAYIVSRENLGEIPSLVAGGSLLIDYVLTVSVSIAAGVLAMYSAFPSLKDYRVEICLGFVFLLTVANLRGVKESGKYFALPTYAYMVAMAMFITWGVISKAKGDLHAIPVDIEGLQEVREHFKVSDGFVPVSAYIFARAFSSGAVALSGVEAISNGIPAFRKPTSRNAAITLVWMSLILGSGFLGISMVASWMKPTPSEHESLISIMGEQLMGRGAPYYFLQFATMAILILAANTAYADFPRLAAILGKDGYLPRQFAARGDRLVFSNGVLILAGLASILLVVFQGDVSKLIPLYAVGVFTSFTLSQSGMVRHHLKEKQKGWRLSMAFSVVGAIATGVVMVVVIVSKFLIGAWIVVVIVPLIVLAFKAVNRHYKSVGAQLRTVPHPEEPVLEHSVVVLVGGLQKSSLAALRYARSVDATNTVALSVAIDEDHAERIRADWDRFGITVPLEILESPYRDLTTIVINHLDELDRNWGHDYVTVVIPEFVTPHWWQGVLHNQSALALKLRLLARRNTVVVSVPFHLFDDTETPDGHDAGLAHPEIETTRVEPVG
ncbi:MAG TPA: APC family permease [Microthrixaceae bacterium]|nr:APC family permease [Microthrixaceae bacterium]HNI34277.1 APC family permease [Microthrixaceae bacterium]